MHPAGADRVLFIFAHQDDEMAAASRILFEQARGSAIFCAFLTDGTLGHASARVRDAESTAALTRLGVAPARILFLGSRVPIADGSLVEHLDLALRSLEQAMAGQDVTTIYCLAWEGGHHDHDASHLVAAAFAARRGILDRCFEMPLYRASAIRPLFRVLAPIAPRASWQRRRIPIREGLRIAFLVRHYVSQRRSWMGLFPGLFAKLVLLRIEVFRRVDPARLREPPHAGTLLYASRFGCSPERFFSAARPFAEAHLPSADRR
jgi:LmbE family N-acetylglucosaminyl deacetylase